MRILMILTLFSGLKESVAQRRWMPGGTPTVCRLIESLDAANELALCFTLRRVSLGFREVELPPLQIKAWLDSPPAWLGLFGKASWYLGEALKIGRVWRHVRAIRPDILYVDRANSWVAGTLARWSGIPVVYRVMGISDDLRACVVGRHPRNAIQRWMLRAPFGAVICTQEGSDGEAVLNALLLPSVPQHHFVNGVDWDRTAAAMDRPAATDVVVLFAGRLEAMKGADEFLEAFLTARSRAPGQLRAVVMGEGARMESMRARVRSADAEGDVTFLGAVPHSTVASIYQRADVYVSLNRMGNLSNTTLEALAHGCCCVLPEPDDSIPRDAVTRQYLPNGTVVRIPSIDDTEALASALVHLAQHGAERQTIAARGQTAARAFIPTWSERIAAEVGLLRDIAGRGHSAGHG